VLRTTVATLFLVTFHYTGLVSNVHSQGNPVTVTESDNNTQVNLNVGDTLVVKLPSTPGTGYSWTVAQNNASLLRPVGANAKPSDTGRPGAPGEQIFQFRAVSGGGEALTLLYRRPFEKGVEAAKKFRVLVTINRQSQAKTITVTDDDNNGRVTLNVGDTLVVKLKSNQTTGYSWRVAENNSSLLQPVGDTGKPGKSGLIGAPGTQVFRFRAVGAGGGERLGLLYQRPFESPSIQAAQKFELMIVINRPTR
jgi:inhibitor of cysteine peptidase